MRLGQIAGPFPSLPRLASDEPRNPGQRDPRDPDRRSGPAIRIRVFRSAGSIVAAPLTSPSLHQCNVLHHEVTHSLTHSFTHQVA